MLPTYLARSDNAITRRLRPGRGLPGGGDLLVLAALACLVAFYYVARADGVGAFTPERGWSSVSPAALPTKLHYLISGLLLGVVPALLAGRLTGKSLGQLGLGVGKLREGATWVAVGVPLAILAARIASRSAAMAAVYPLDPELDATAARFVPHAGASFLYYGAWEGLFRGVLLFGLRDRLGSAGANVFQTALSVTAHFGRPFDETLAAVPAGLVFGAIALRTGSIWPIALVHWTVGVATDWFLVTA